MNDHLIMSELDQEPSMRSIGCG